MSDINGLINWIEPGLPPKNFGRYGINTESLLLRAIAYGDEEELDKILKFSAFDCDSRITVHGERQALLSLAIKSHQAGCVRILCEAGCNMSPNNINDQPPIVEAAGSRNIKIVQILLEHGANPNERSYLDGRTALHHAAKEGHTEIIELLVRHGADLDKKDRANETALSLAMRRYVPERVVRDEDYRSLFLDPTVITQLMDLGTDPFVITGAGRSYLHLACISGDLLLMLDMIDYVKKATTARSRPASKLADLVNKKNAVTGTTALCEAVKSLSNRYLDQRNIIDIIERMADMGFDFRTDGDLLTEAAKRRLEPFVIRFLLVSMADMGFDFKADGDLLSEAVKRKMEPFVIRFLLMCGSAVTIPVLKSSIARGCPEVVSLLILSDATSINKIRSLNATLVAKSNQQIQDVLQHYRGRLLSLKELSRIFIVARTSDNRGCENQLQLPMDLVKYIKYEDL